MSRNTVWNDFRTHVLHSGNVLNALLAINIGVFVLLGLLSVFAALFQLSFDPGHMIQEHILSLPSNLGELLMRPWSLVTYQFAHANLFHLLSNALMLWFAGRIFREFLGDQRMLSTYLLGGVAGGVVFILTYYLFPRFSGMEGILIGASASVMAVLAGAATIVPHYTVYIILLGPVRLVYVAIALFIFDLLYLTSSNAGGHFAHLGGTLWGFLYVRGLQNGRDMAGWLGSFQK